MWVGPYGLADLFTQRKSRSHIIHPDHVVAKHGPGRSLATRRTCQRDDRIGMGMVDVRVRDKCVHERFNRWARATRLKPTAIEICHHLIIAHLLAFQQGQNLVQPQAGKIGWLAVRQIQTTPLDP